MTLTPPLVVATYLFARADTGYLVRVELGLVPRGGGGAGAVDALADSWGRLGTHALRPPLALEHFAGRAVDRGGLDHLHGNSTDLMLALHSKLALVAAHHQATGSTSPRWWEATLATTFASGQLRALPANHGMTSIPFDVDAVGLLKEKLEPILEYLLALETAVQVRLLVPAPNQSNLDAWASPPGWKRERLGARVTLKRGEAQLDIVPVGTLREAEALVFDGHLGEVHAAVKWAADLVHRHQGHTPDGPLALTIDPGAECWTILGPEQDDPPHVVASPLTDLRLLEAIVELRHLASLPVRRGDAAAPSQQAQAGTLARLIGERLTGTLLSPVIRQELCERLGKVGVGRARLTIRVSGEDERVDAALALPWELLMPKPGQFVVRDGALDVVREAIVPDAPTLPVPDKRLSVLVHVAAPEDSSRLRHEDEAYRLWQALVPLQQQAYFTDLGSVDDLLNLAEVYHPTALHFSGHGGPGQLIFENDVGTAHAVDVEALIRQLRQRLVCSGDDVGQSADGGRLPALFFLASCYGAGGVTGASHQHGDHAACRHEAFGQGPSTAAALHRAGFVQVVGYFGPVNDALCTRSEDAFYRALAHGATTLQAVVEARLELAKKPDGDEPHFPWMWMQLALYHRGPDRPLTATAAQKKRTIAPRPSRLARHDTSLNGLPALQHGFIGRRSLLHRLRRQVRNGQRLLVLQGLGGLGKTALATHFLLHGMVETPADVLVLRAKELGPTDDPALLFWSQAREHGTTHGLPDWEAQMRALDEQHPAPVAGFEQTLLHLHQHCPDLVVYGDNFESLQQGPAEGEGEVGAWRPSAEPVWAVLERLSRTLRLVLLSTRYTWNGLEPDAWIAVEPMRPVDVVRMIETFPTLRTLDAGVQRWLAERVDGHPRTVEYLETLVRDQKLRVGSVADAAEQRRKWVEPVLPAGAQQIRADLLLDVLWDRLSEPARQHAQALTVLRTAAPLPVVSALGEATEELQRTGLLTLHRVQVQGKDGDRSTTKWAERWGMHAVVAEFVAPLVAEAVRQQGHEGAGRAYAAWVTKEGALWSEQREGIHHLHEAKLGDEAWPLAAEYAIHMRSQARYREALEVVVASEGAGASGETLAHALGLGAQLMGLLGHRAEQRTRDVERALTLPGVSNTLAGFLWLELASAFQNEGRLEDAETAIRKSLVMHERTVGVEHPSYGASLHQLAIVQEQQGKYREAETTVRHSLSIDERTVGVEHPSYAASMHQLAIVQEMQGKYDEAETTVRQALGIKERTVGVEHPSYGASLHQLAIALGKQGKSDEAESTLRQSLGIKERTVGEENPSTLASLANLAGLVAGRGDTGEAVALLQRAATTCRRTLGSASPVTAQVLANLAALQARAGHADAQATAAEALASLASFGPEHPLTRELAPGLQRTLAGSAPDAGRLPISAALEAGQQALEEGDAEGARAILTEARAQAVADGSWSGESTACFLLARASLALKDKEQAQEHAHRCWTLFRDHQITPPEAVGQLLGTLLLQSLERANALEAEGQIVAAIAWATRVAEQAETVALPGVEGSARLWVAQTLLDQGQRAGAEPFLRRVLQLAEQLGDEGAARRVRGLLG